MGSFAPPGTGSPPSNQISNLKATPSKTSLSVAVTFKITLDKVTNVTSIVLLRSFAKPDLSTEAKAFAANAAATVLANVPIQSGQFSYIDGDPKILGVTAYYWVLVTIQIQVGIGTFSQRPPWQVESA